MHGHMLSDSLGAATGSAPERSSLTGGVPSVSNAGVIGGVVHLAAVLRVAHVRLRRRSSGGEGFSEGEAQWTVAGQ